MSRKIVIEKEVFKFEELSDKAKETAKRELLEGYHDAEMFSECLEEEARCNFPHSELKFEYSLSYCQGDGLNVYGLLSIKDAVDFVLIGCANNFTEKEKKFLNFLRNEDFEIKIETHNNHYCYYTDKTEDIRYDCELQMEGNYYRDIPYETIEKFSKTLNSLLKDYCGEKEDEGYKWFYEMDDEEAKELCEWNENEFTEDGKIYW